MTALPVWVLGSGGLLGSAVSDRLPLRLPGAVRWSPGPRRYSWNDPPVLASELAASASAYGRAIAESGGPWMALWCAGTGTVASSAESMARETDALRRVLDGLAAATGDRPGCFFLASSAGGVYGGNRESPLTERTSPEPSSDYGREKLRQERIVEEWAASRPRVSTLAGRISNLYGPKQNLEKAQGLIAHLSRSLLHHVPAHVYAPLDTIRDHLYAPDAADQILRCMERLASAAEPARLVKIVASGQTASIAAILSIFTRIARRQPRIVCAAGGARSQPGRLALKSVVWPDTASPDPTPLAVGIQSVYRSQLALYQAGRLPLPYNPL